MKGKSRAKRQPSEAELDAAAELIQSAALGDPEPEPVLSAAAVINKQDAERYDPIVATQSEAIVALYKLLDVNGDGILQASELMTVVSQYTGSVFKETEFFEWYDKHGAGSVQGPDGQVDMKEFGWYMADVALTFGEGDEAKAALPAVIKAFKKLASGRTPLLTRIFKELDVTDRHAPCWPRQPTQPPLVAPRLRTARPGFNTRAPPTVAQR